MEEKEKTLLSADPNVLAWVQEGCDFLRFSRGDRGALKSRLPRPMGFQNKERWMGGNKRANSKSSMSIIMKTLKREQQKGGNSHPWDRQGQTRDGQKS